MSTIADAEWVDETTALMVEAAKKPMSHAERRGQMISFAMAMMGNESTMTREDVEKLAEEKYGPVVA